MPVSISIPSLLHSAASDLSLLSLFRRATQRLTIDCRGSPSSGHNYRTALENPYSHTPASVKEIFFIAWYDSSWSNQADVGINRLGIFFPSTRRDVLFIEIKGIPFFFTVVPPETLRFLRHNMSREMSQGWRMSAGSVDQMSAFRHHSRDTQRSAAGIGSFGCEVQSPHVVDHPFIKVTSQ